MFFISSHGIPEAVLPCSPASKACRKLQALLKAVSRAHPCSPLPGQAGQLKFPGTTEQGLFGHCQAASGLLPLGCQGSCTERKGTDLGGGQEWEWGTQTGAQSKLVIMLTIQAATQNGFFGVHLNESIKPNYFFLVLNPLVLQVKMKAVKRIVCFISTYCHCR